MTSAGKKRKRGGRLYGLYSGGGEGWKEEDTEKGVDEGGGGGGGGEGESEEEPGGQQIVWEKGLAFKWN